jgi:hypothetical protein
MTTYKLHTDSGHGWLEVGRDELTMLHIEDMVSRYSYQAGNKVYLEEDCDASVFVNALENMGTKVEYNSIHTDGDSPIRMLKRYTKW